jgi:peptide/nickel transport system permease protein
LTRGTPVAWFPTSGFESLDTTQMTTLEYIGDVAWHCVLPVLCMSYAALAALSRYARTGLLDVIRSDYVRTARAKGLPESIVILKHAARNGMIPILTLLASLLPALIGGSVVIEVVFGIPGMGSYLFESITVRDYNAVMAVLLISAALTLVGMLFSDLSYALVDPRITFD